jgi:dTDP-4-amino-4,6-dideoxygalactose transaminase
MINVTKTYLPSFDEYTRQLKRAWDKGWITNNGELVKELEQKLKDYLGVKHLFFCCNGTIVLQMALKALKITKEVVTTPFSYVATTNSILWENCCPVFTDINDLDFNIDADKIENAITHNTEAILVTHVFGNPCNVEKLEAISRKHNLKIIYDGAHAFGVNYNNKSLLSYGDVATCSFHATKLFHTVEGGAIMTNDDAIAHQLMLYRQFGHVYDDYYSMGINAKNSEFHAAMGLAIFPHIPAIIEKRKTLSEYYKKLLCSVDLKRPIALLGTEHNFGYFPVVFNNENELIQVKELLEKNEINTRRYFFPSLNELQFLKVRFDCPISENISRNILCLPLYAELELKSIEQICSIIKDKLTRSK